MEELTWEAARQKCKKDGGDLACFNNQQERDFLTDKCDGCWVGYTWQDGKLLICFVDI